MMETGAHFQDIAQAIQLSVAPVFLLTGVGTTLAVLVSRLTRIVDRARVTESELQQDRTAEPTELQERLRILAERARLISWAITLSVLCALLVPLMIVALFVSAIMKINLALPITVGFIVALLSLVIGLVYFLREVFVATAALTFGQVKQTNALQTLQRILRRT